MKSYLPYAKQSIQESDLFAATEALKGDIITRGKHVQDFENKIADYCNVQYAVAFNSGTSALFAAYFAAKVTSFDHILSSPNTFIATVGPGLAQNNVPHFVDIDRRTGNINLEKFKEKMSFRSTRGRLVILPVHFSGIAIDMKALNKMLFSHPDAVVIEDAAHAIGSLYPSGEKVGSCAWSDMTIFSFHPAKTITTGEGGVVTTNNPEFYHRLQLFRNNGIERDPPYISKEEYTPGYYEVHEITGNFHFTDFQAALGLSQMNRIDSIIEKRRKLMKIYREELREIPDVVMFTDKYDAFTAFHLCVVQIDYDKYRTTREKVMQKLNDKGIGSQVHYIPIYHHPVYQKLYKDTELSHDFPETEKYYAEALSLPLYYDLEERDVIRVCQDLNQILVSSQKKKGKK